MRVTVFSTNDLKKNSGALVVGGLALAAGFFIVDHHFSPKGKSAWDGVMRKVFGGGAHRVGAEGSSDIKKLPPYAQQVIQHAISSETDANTLKLLAEALSGAGFSQAAAQVKAKAGA